MSKSKLLPVLTIPNASVCPSEINGAALTERGIKSGAVCGDCRGIWDSGDAELTCFDRKDIAVYYPTHGFKLDLKNPNITATKDKGRNLITCERTGNMFTITVTTRNGFTSTATLNLNTVVIKPSTKMLLPNTVYKLHSETGKMKYFRSVSDKVAGKLTQIASFNLSAYYSHASAHLNDFGLICPGYHAAGACGHCYAQQGNYGTLSSVTASETRTAFFIYHLQNNFEYLLEIMVQMIYWQTIKRNVYRFRWFDAGDCSSALMAQLILAVVNRLNEICDAAGIERINHWLPTRSGIDTDIVKDTPRYRLLAPIATVLRDAPPNLLVRPSGLVKGYGGAPTYSGFAAGSGVIDYLD
jgi:hypothetical protein